MPIKHIYVREESDNVRVISTLFTLGVTFMITACAPGSPVYPILHNVPSAQVTALNSVISEENIQGFELPTYIPFSVVEVLFPTPSIDPVRKHYINIYMRNKTHVLNITAQSVRNSGAAVSDGVALPNERSVKLANGVNALYGVNSASSQLAWIKNGVLYMVLSTNVQNKADLTEEQLVQVANSFT